jgi:hypothetical protein
MSNGIRRTRIIKEDKFWEVFQRFVDKGLIMSDLEIKLGLGSGYIRSVKSKKRIPKYDTYKKISDNLRERQQLSEIYKGLINPEEMESILDVVQLEYEFSKRKINFSKLADYVSMNDHTLSERLRYWRNKKPINMTLKTLRDLENSLRQWDINHIYKEAEDLEAPKWDFYAEQKQYLETGKFSFSLKD